MAKPVLLLGAGASMDAGLPNAFELTSNVYGRLKSSRPKQAKLFAYVLSKIVTKQVREGVSPFQPVNVEVAYDALKRLISRDTDVLSEFVYSWDPITFDQRSEVDSVSLVNAIIASLKMSQERSGKFSVTVDTFKARSAAKAMTEALDRQAVGDIASQLKPYLETLVSCLQPAEPTHQYIDELVKYSSRNISMIATLNYDLLLENSARAQSINYDYGLRSWNSRRYVKFHGDNLKIAKLHGSIDWYLKEDEIHIFPENKERLVDRAMVFGGQTDKLVPYGPFLQIRHEFQEHLRQTNVLAVVGYSFADIHLNALIRSWVSSRRKAKLIIVDPGTPRLGSDALGRSYRTDKEGNPKYTVEIKQISATAKTAIFDLFSELEKPPLPGPLNS